MTSLRGRRFAPAVPNGRRTVPYGPALAQFGEFWPQPDAEDAPFVVLVHGGFWRPGKSLSSMTKLAQALHINGCAVWNVEYGISSQPATCQRTLDDVAMAIDFGLRSLGRKPDARPAVVTGHSAGGQLALVALRRLAQRTPMAWRSPGFVGLAPITDMPTAFELGLGEGAVRAFTGANSPKDALLGRLCPTKLLPCGMRTHLIHGRRDRRVPLSMSESFVASAKRAGDVASLTVLPHATHASLIDPATQSGRLVVGITTDLAAATQLRTRVFNNPATTPPRRRSAHER
jgi:acetyl esterase/lipase